jgi:hypothetical protein
MHEAGERRNKDQGNRQEILQKKKKIKFRVGTGTGAGTGTGTVDKKFRNRNLGKMARFRNTAFKC